MSKQTKDDAKMRDQQNKQTDGADKSHNVTAPSHRQNAVSGSSTNVKERDTNNSRK